MYTCLTNHQHSQGPAWQTTLC